MKCQTCKRHEADYTWQPFGPGESPYCIASLGWHYRGFPTVKICDRCKERIEETQTPVGQEYKEVFHFTYKKIGYYLLDGKIQTSPF